MKASHLANILDDAVLAEVQRLKLLSADELLALGSSGQTVMTTIDNQPYEITAWSEPVADKVSGLFVVLAGAWQRRLVGSTHHLRGFVVRGDREYIDMAASELWQYD